MGTVFKNYFFIILIISLVLILIPAALFAAGGEEERQVIMLAVDGLSLPEWQYAAENFPAIEDFLDKSSMALLNTRTAGRLTSENAYVTIGAGARAEGTGYAGLALNTDETYEYYPAGKVYKRYTGREPQGEVVHLGINTINEANESANFSIVPGALGTLLKEAGLKRAVLGNGDHKNLNRLAVNLAMDEYGVVDYGTVNKEILKGGGELSAGFMTDVDRLWKNFWEYKNKCQYIVIEWGDTFRLRETEPLLSSERAEALFDLQLNNLAEFLERISPLLNSETILILVTPTPEGIIIPGDGDLSLLAINNGDEGPGLLTSDTTRRPGLVTNTDIASTVLSYFDISSPSFLYGSAIKKLPSNSSQQGLSGLMELNRQISNVHQQRPPLIKFYILLQIIMVISAVGALFLRRNLYKYLKYPMMSLMLFPLSFLLLSVVQPGNLYLSFLAVILLTLFLTWVFKFRTSSYVAFFLRIGAVTSLAIILDLLTGAELIKNSILGYDAISGSRFYGIGNEYMGIFIGSAVLFIASVYQLKFNKKPLVSALSLSFFVLIIYLLLSPRWGANFGGSLTALTAFTVTFLGLEDWKLDKKNLSRVIGIMVLFVLALVLLNYKGEDGMVSHVGKAFNLVRVGGLEEVANILIRKGAMNLKLFRYSLWSRILVVFLGLLIVLLYQPPGLLKKIIKKYTKLFKGFAGIIAGSVVAILVNDSGVVAGATTLMFAGIPIILLVMHHTFKDDLNKLKSLKWAGK